MGYRIISADSHLDLQWLPHDAFTSRAPVEWKEKVPYVESRPDGNYWMVEGRTMTRAGWYGPGVNGGKRGEMLEREGFTIGDLRCSDYKLRKADQTRDGVDAEVIYGILTTDRSFDDKEALAATYRAYNDYISEWQQHDPNWLVPLGEIPNHDGKVAGAELSRLAQIGVRGAEFAPATMTHPFWSDEWEPLWEAGAETQLPLSFHAFNISTTFSDKDHPAAAAVNLVLAPSRADEVLCSLIFSGILERHPRFKAILGESGIGWLPFTLERMDYSYDRRLTDLKLPLLPSEYFKRQVYASFIIDYWGTKAMWELGYLKNIMWSTDYPHRDGSWPDSQEVIERTFKNLPEDVKRACVHDNVVSLFNLND